MGIRLAALAFFLFGQNLKAETKTLDIKSATHYQISIEPSVYGVFRDGNTIYTFPRDEAFYIKSTYKPDAKEADLAFGSLHNPYDGSERVPFEPKDKRKRIRGMLRVGPRLAFLDSVTRQFHVFHEEKKVWQLPSDIILDVARPARDARGEPTRAEVAAARAKLTKELSREKENPDLLVGVAEIPKSWKDRDGSQYVLWLREISTPLLTMKCDQSEFRNCVVKRACSLKGLNVKDALGVTSIALDRKNDQIMLLKGYEQKVFRLTGKDCFSLRSELAFHLSKSLGNAQGLFIDATNKLWLSLREADGSSSASVFVFNTWP